MNIQYLSDNDGHVTAVQVSIKDWERLKLVHPEITDLDSPLPDWQKALLDKRLATIEKHPELVKPISSLIDKIDTED